MNGYFDEVDEPLLNNENIICAMFITRINKQDLFCYITNDEEMKIKYLIASSKDFIDVYSKFSNTFNNINEIVVLDGFQKDFKGKLLKQVNLNNSEQMKILKEIEKIKLSEYENAHNMGGLDGFGVHLKLQKGNKEFYSWMYSTDEKYFFIIDFVNQVLELINIDQKYRFKKVRI